MTEKFLVHFESAGEEYALCYQARNSPMVQLFVELLGTASDQRIAYGSTLLVADTEMSSFETCSDKVIDLVKVLRCHYPSLFDNLNLPQILDQAALNDLHQRFELFEHTRASLASRDHVRLFWEFNRLIHKTEGALERRNSASVCPAKSKVFYSAQPDVVNTKKLSLAHYEYMEIQLKPDTLYMGYYTVGKNFLSIWRQNDFELLERRLVSPQVSANTQIVGLFGSDDLVPDAEIKAAFFDWWDEHRVTERFGYTKSDQALALGWFPLGDLAQDSAVSLPDDFTVVGLTHN